MSTLLRKIPRRDVEITIRVTSHTKARLDEVAAAAQEKEYEFPLDAIVEDLLGEVIDKVTTELSGPAERRPGRPKGSKTRPREERGGGDAPHPPHDMPAETHMPMTANGYGERA